MNPAVSDIRMRGFPSRTEVAAVVALLQQRTATLETETVELPAAAVWKPAHVTSDRCR